MNLKGVRVLLTQNDIYSINGSAVIILELAQYLKGAGATVQVYTYYLEDPLKSIFEKHDIAVTTSDDDLSLDDFDYIWVHQQVLPLSIIKELKEIDKRVSTPIFIFNHMSPLDYIPDEFPYIWDLENNLSSLSVFHSSYTKELQESLLDPGLNKALYPNPAPMSFSRRRVRDNKKIKSILVVSNHPPKEILGLRDKCTDADIQFTILGESAESYELISRDLLEEYDLVITIGKTVQNCLVSATPVYVYDHFGGPGYLNESNYDLAEHRNFSRGFNKKTTDDIFNEILDDYQTAVEFIQSQWRTFVEKFTVDTIAQKTFRTASIRSYKQLSSSYLAYLIYSHNYSREHRIAARQRMVYKKELDSMRGLLDSCRIELDEIKESKAYILGNKIATPVRILKDLKGVKK